MDTDALTDEERAELEQLRAEKAAREEAARAAAERAELEQLRAESKAAQSAEKAARAQAQGAAAAKAQEAAVSAQEAADVERARQMMEPDDELKMAPGQKIVILAVFAVAVVWLLITYLG